MARSHGNAIKDDEQYEALRDEQGMSKEKAARIANSTHPGKTGGSHVSYEQWTREELYEKAQQVGLEGRTTMTKNQLKRALREH